MRSFLLLAFLAFSVALVSAGANNRNNKCKLMNDAGTGINTEFLLRHPVHTTGLLQPGQIYLMNNTWMHCHEPGVTTFEDDYTAYAYQYNFFQFNDDDDCGFGFNQAYKRGTGHWVIAPWMSHILLDQWASQEQVGEGPVKLENAYQVEPMLPRIFEQAGLGALNLRSRHMSFNTEITVFNLPVQIPGLGTVELPVLDEVLASLPGRPGDFYYSMSLYQGIHNNYADWGYIYKTTHACATATGDLAEACAAIAAFMSGQTTLEDDPLATAAGFPGYKVHTYIVPSAKRSVDAAAGNVKWPDHQYARITYDMLVQGKVEGLEGPMRYVNGLHVSEAEHRKNFGL